MGMLESQLTIPKILGSRIGGVESKAPVGFLSKCPTLLPKNQ